MRTFKHGNKVYKAEFTQAEKKAMHIEIQAELADYDRKHIREIDALVLWHIHQQLGFGHDRLKKFYMAFNSGMRELIRRYEMCDKDQVWLCTTMLKNIGVDLEQWEKEEAESEKENEDG